MSTNVSMPCRDVSQLLPVLQRGAAEFLRRCKEAGLNVLITQTYRSTEYQNTLYAQGRTTPGIIVTNAKGGQSPHEFRYAFDICKNVKGQEYSDTEFFKQCGKIWATMGGEWGGNWKNFVDMPHFQYTAGFTDQQMRAGAKIPNDAKMLWEAHAHTGTTPSTPIASTVKFDIFGEKKDVRGSIVDGVTIVEARQLVEAMGFLIGWNGATSVVEVRRKDSD